jgi:bacteriocin-like protein
VTNIDSNELSTNELEAVSGGDLTITVATPSKETVQKVGETVQTVANVVAGVLNPMTAATWVPWSIK